RWTGSFVSAARDTVTFRDQIGNSIVSVPTLQVRRFEVSRGKLTNGVRGASWGFWIGAGLGAASSTASNQGGDESLGLFGTTIGHALILGAAGTVIGTVLGLAIRSEHWRSLPPEQLRGAAQP